MKKLSLILCIAMLFCSLMSMPVLAETTDLDSNMVRHYNFYDCVQTTRPKDVTEAGTGKKYSLYAPNVVTEGGLGYTKAAGGSYYSCGDKDDINTLSDMSFFLAFKHEGIPTSTFAHVLYATGLIRVIIDENGLGVQTLKSNTWLNVTADNATRHSIEMGKTVWLCVSLDWGESLVGTVHISTDCGKTYESYTTTIANSSESPATYTALVLGKKGGAEGSSNVIDLYFDDLRIYNKALTGEEFAGIKLDKSPSIAPHHISVQSRSNTGNYDVRFCAVLDQLNYSEVGFEIIATDANGVELKKFDHTATSVYESVLALGETVTANDICEGSKYLIAFAVLEIPDDIGVVNFNVRSYGTDEYGAFYSDTVTFTFDGSTYVVG